MIVKISKHNSNLLLIGKIQKQVILGLVCNYFILGYTEASDSRVAMQLFHSRLDQFYEHMSAILVPESVLGQGNPILVTGIGHRQNTEIREPHHNSPSSSRHVLLIVPCLGWTFKV